MDLRQCNKSGIGRFKQMNKPKLYFELIDIISKDKKIQGSYDKNKVCEEYNLVVPTKKTGEDAVHESCPQKVTMKHVRTWRNCLM